MPDLVLAALAVPGLWGLGLAIVAAGLVRGYPLAQTPVGYDEEDDRLGAAFGVADLDADGRAELIAGVPGESPGAEPKSGMVLVYRMPRPALDAWYALTQEGGAIARD